MVARWPARWGLGAMLLFAGCTETTSSGPQPRRCSKTEPCHQVAVRACECCASPAARTACQQELASQCEDGAFYLAPAQSCRDVLDASLDCAPLAPDELGWLCGE